MDVRERLAAHLPVYALEVRTPRLVLRFPDDADVVDLAELGAAGVHDPEFSPFEARWTDVEPPRQQRNTIDFFCGERARSRGTDWSLPLAVVVDGEVAGIQHVGATKWSQRRTVGTGSWLGRAFQGRGIGTEMRLAVLHLAFDGFGAVRAETAAWHDNAPSLGVTTTLGYRPNGTARVVRTDVADTQHRFVMEPDDFARVRRADIELVGAQAVAALFHPDETDVPGT